MPYITQVQRPIIDAKIHDLVTSTELGNAQYRKNSVDKITEGELNYMIIRLIQIWCAHRGVSYSTFNAAIGVLNCVLQEFYRMVVSPYEDQKIAENKPVGILDISDHSS